MRDTRESRIDRTIEQDSFTLSIRKDSHKRELKRLFKHAEQKNFTEDIFEAIEFWNRYAGNPRSVKDDWGDYIDNEKEDIQEILTDSMNISGDKLEDKTKSYLRGRLKVELEDQYNLDAMELDDTSMDYLKGLIRGINKREEMTMTEDISKVEKLKKQLGEMYKDQVELDEDLQEKVESGELTKAEAHREQLTNRMHQGEN